MLFLFFQTKIQKVIKLSKMSNTKLSQTEKNYAELSVLILQV